MRGPEPADCPDADTVHGTSARNVIGEVSMQRFEEVDLLLFEDLFAHGHC